MLFRSQRIERTYFASRESDVMVIKLAAKGEKLNVKIEMSRPKVSGTIQMANVIPDGILELTGILNSGKKDTDGVLYAACVGVKTDGIKSSTDENLYIEHASEIYLIVSAATSYVEGANYKARATELLADAMECNINAMQQKAVIDYKELYDRASVDRKSVV